MVAAGFSLRLSEAIGYQQILYYQNQKGILSIKEVFQGDKRTLVSNLMAKDLVTVTPEVDQERVVHVALAHQIKSIPVVDLRELRFLTRYRHNLVGYLVGEKNRLNKLLDGCGIRLGCVVSDINGVSAQRIIKALLEGDKSPEEMAELVIGRLEKKKPEIILALNGFLSDRHRFVLERIINHIDWLQQQLAEIDAQVVTAMKPYQREWRLLQTIPGLDQIGAAMLLAEIGIDMGRFGSKERLCSWAGMCLGNNESAGKKKSGKTPPGNKYVRQLLCEAAHSANKTNSQFKGFFQGLVIRRGKKRAIMAVGHKLLQVIYVVLSKKEAYKDPGVDYEKLTVSRNAPRWLKALEKYGFLPNQAEPQS